MQDETFHAKPIVNEVVNQKDDASHARYHQKLPLTLLSIVPQRVNKRALYYSVYRIIK